MNRSAATPDPVALVAGGALLTESVVCVVMFATAGTETSRLLGGPVLVISLVFGCFAAGGRWAAGCAAWGLALLTWVVVGFVEVVVNVLVVALRSWAYVRLGPRPTGRRRVVRAPEVVLAAAGCLAAGVAFAVRAGAGVWTSGVLAPEEPWWYAAALVVARAVPGEALVCAAVGVLRGSTRWALTAMAVVALICFAVVRDPYLPTAVGVSVVVAAAVLLALLALAFRQLRHPADGLPDPE